MAGYQITHAYELYEVCLLEGEDCFKAQLERMELLTLMWDGSLRYQVLLSFLFFYLAGYYHLKIKQPMKVDQPRLRPLRLARTAFYAAS